MKLAEISASALGEGSDRYLTELKEKILDAPRAPPCANVSVVSIVPLPRQSRTGTTGPVGQLVLDLPGEEEQGLLSSLHEAPVKPLTRVSPPVIGAKGERVRQERRRHSGCRGRERSGDLVGHSRGPVGLEVLLREARWLVVILAMLVVFIASLGTAVEEFIKRILGIILMMAVLIGSPVLYFRWRARRGRKRILRPEKSPSLASLVLKEIVPKVVRRGISELLQRRSKEGRRAERAAQEHRMLPSNYSPVRKTEGIGRHRTSTIKQVALADDKCVRVRFRPDEVSGERMFVDCTVFGQRTRAMLDSGSEVNLISESLLRQIEKGLGRGLPRIRSSTVLSGLGDQPVSNSGVVLLDLMFDSCKKNGETLLLEGVPFFICANQIGLLVGAPILTKLQTEFTYQGVEMYASFRRLPRFGGLEVRFGENAFLDLELAAAEVTVLPPKKWVKLQTHIPGLKTVSSTSWANERVLVEKAALLEDAPVKFDEIVSSPNACYSINVYNESTEQIALPPKSPVFHVSLLKANVVADVSELVHSAYVKSQCQISELKTCVCKLEGVSVAYVMLFNGMSYLGHSFPSLNVPALKGEAGIHRRGQVHYIIPDKESEFDRLAADPKSFLGRFKNNHLVVLLADPMQVSVSLLALISRLRSHVHVDIRLVAAKSLCAACSPLTLASLPAKMDVHVVTNVNIVLPSSYRFSKEAGKSRFLRAKLDAGQEGKGAMPGAGRNDEVKKDEKKDVEKARRSAGYEYEEENKVKLKAALKKRGREGQGPEGPECRRVERSCPGASSVSGRTGSGKALPSTKLAGDVQAECEKKEEVGRKRNEVEVGEIMEFHVEDVVVDVFLTSRSEVSVFPHLPTIWCKDAMMVARFTTLLVVELRRHFFDAALVVVSNVPDEGEYDIFAEGISDGLRASRYFPAFENCPPRPRRPPKAEKGNVEESQFMPKLVKKRCPCSFCLTAAGDMPNTKVLNLRPIYYHVWPQFTDREVQQAFEREKRKENGATSALKKSVAHVAALTARFTSSEASGASGPAPKMAEKVEVTARQADWLWAPINESFYYALPTPQPRTSTISLSEIDRRVDLSQFDDRIRGPLRLLLFLFRDIFRIEDDDYGIITSLIASINVYPQFRNATFFSAGYKVHQKLVPLVRELADAKLRAGLWSERPVSITSAFFLILRGAKKRSLDEHGQPIVKLQQLDDITLNDVRGLADVRRLNDLIKPDFSDFSLTNLNHSDLGHFIHGSKYNSQIDLSGAFDSILCRESDRKLLGLQLGRELTLASNVLLQGLKVSPQIFMKAIRQAFATIPSLYSFTLAFMDDFLVSSTPPTPVLLTRDGKLGQPCVGLRHTPGHCQVCQKEPSHCLCHLSSAAALTEDIPPSFDPSSQSRLKSHVWNLYNVRSIPPNKSSHLRKLLERYDPSRYLPHNLIIRLYYCFPYHKGQDWETALEEEKNFPKYESVKDPSFDEKQLKQHFINLSLIFHGVRNSGAKASLGKLKLLASECTFFGHSINPTHISILPKKLAFLNKFQDASTVKDVQSALGHILHFSFFVNGLSIYTRYLYNKLSLPPKTPLTEFDKQLLQFVIGKVQGASPLPHLPANVPAIICVDSGPTAGGACVGFEFNGKFVISEYFSVAYAPVTCSLLSHIEKEILIQALLLLSSPHLLCRERTTILVTDSLSLYKILNAEDCFPLGSRLYKMATLLRSLNIAFRLRFRPSADPKIVLSDFLSRKMCYPYFVPGSLSQKLLAGEDVTPLPEDVEATPLDRKVVEKDWASFELPALKALIRSGVFNTSKKMTALDEDEQKNVISRVYALRCEADLVQFTAPPIDLAGDLLDTFAAQQVGFLSAALAKRGWKPKASTFQRANEQEALVFAIQAKKSPVAKLQRLYQGPFDPDQLRKGQKADAKLGPIITAFIEGTASKTQRKKYSLLPSFLLARIVKRPHPQQKIILTKDLALTVIARCHILGHTSIESLTLIIKRYFYVENLRNLCTLVVAGCTACAVNKNFGKRHCGPGRIPRPERALTVFSLDHMSLTPVHSKNIVYRHVLSVYCMFSKFSVLFPLRTLKAGETINCLKSLINVLGIPEAFTCDQGPCFRSDDLRNFCNEMGIRLILQPPYQARSHPVERLNLTARIAIRVFSTALSTSNWVSLLPYVNQALRNMKRAIPCMTADGQKIIRLISPTEVVFGRPPFYTLDVLLQRLTGSTAYAPALASERERLVDEIKRANDHAKAAFEAKDHLDQLARVQLKPGSLCLLARQPYDKNRTSYLPNVYQVVSVFRRKACLVQVHPSTQNPKSFVTHVRFLKLFTADHALFEKLPNDLKAQLTSAFHLPLNLTHANDELQSCVQGGIRPPNLQPSGLASEQEFATLDGDFVSNFKNFYHSKSTVFDDLASCLESLSSSEEEEVPEVAADDEAGAVDDEKSERESEISVDVHASQGDPAEGESELHESLPRSPALDAPIAVRRPRRNVQVPQRLHDFDLNVSSDSD